ncbi:50S ribosomal protein L19 [Candidatus Gottesmanbacteria bacterium]|nr:50S ribosomal protein L19 [Candidatus Gottesmanbacteria bacterium]
MVLHVGDTLKVFYKLIEKEKIAGKTKREVKEETRERIQIFEGILLSIRGVPPHKSILVRKIASNAIGVERIFPLSSPWIKDINVVRSAVVRRAKLYYLRNKTGKEVDQLKDPETAKKITARLTKTKRTKKPVAHEVKK